MSNLERHDSIRHQQSKILTGVLVIAFGTLYLLKKADINIPHWLLSWESVLIAFGFVTLYKHRFNHFFGYIMIGVGSVFMINEFRPHTINPKFILPVIVILVGFMIIGKTMNLFGSKNKMKDQTIFGDDVDTSSDDFIRSTTLFGGVTKNVVSKNFEGAEFTTLFGGTEINLTQADIQKPVTIKASTAFGGLTVIVPSNWEVNSELVTAFGGIEDKRAPMSEVSRDPNKVLTLKGSCVFGGVEIQSYI